jgi:mannosylglycoprotein endo-beta-mannosidase
LGVTRLGSLGKRNILEGVLILHEVVHELKKTNGKGLILKIDFEKTYDKVRWDFLEKVMQGKGFLQNGTIG